MKTIDDLSIEKYGKPYRELPDDGAEQDCIQGEFSRLCKTLVFEGVGWERASSSSDVGNCRIRTRIKNNDGVFVYLEINGFERSKYDKPQRPFEITGYVMHCYSQDCNERSEWRKLEHARFNYTASALIEFVNQNLNCSFNALRVVNDGSVLVHETWQPLCESIKPVPSGFISDEAWSQ